MSYRTFFYSLYVVARGRRIAAVEEPRISIWNANAASSSRENIMNYVYYSVDIRFWKWTVGWWIYSYVIYVKKKYIFFWALSVKVVLIAPNHWKMWVLSEFFWKSEQAINHSSFCLTVINVCMTTLGLVLWPKTKVCAIYVKFKKKRIRIYNDS